MFKAHLLLAGTALLLAGTAQAAEPEAQAEPESIAVAHQEAPAPRARDEARDTTANAAASEAEQELHPDARPVYLNGGHFGGN